MIRVFITDDHPLVVEGLRALLGGAPDLELIGWASSAASCLAFLRHEQPDVLLLDINLPDQSGITLCREIRAAYPAVVILGLSTFGQASFVQSLLDNGAAGYVLKNATRDELREAIHRVRAGERYLSPEADAALHAALPPNALPVLTRREKEVLEHIAEGLTNREIADKLFISPTTVDTHRQSLLLKLNAKNTAMLVKVAISNGLIGG